MAKIEPFRALIYNQGEIKSLSFVACPPYDVISPSQQQYYYSLHPNNFLHILLAKDIPGEDKYRRASQLFKDWQKDRIFVPDRSPAIYFYSQQYSIKGEKRRRLGFIARLYLENKNTGIYTHEHTRPEAKEDRFKLLKAVRANLSPIFALFADKKRVINNIYQGYIQDKKPFIDVVDLDKVNHKLWRLDSPDTLTDIKAKMQNENIFIADGHHRYEVACAYRDEMAKRSATADPQAGYNYLLSYFTNIDSSGLTILPIHRLLKLSSSPDINKFILSLENYFDVEEVKDRTRFFFLMEKGGRSEHLMGMYYARRWWLIRLKNIKILDEMIEDKPHEYRSLDVSILNCIILKKILGIDLEDKQILTFTPDVNELIDKVDSGGSYIGFILNPVKVEQIISVALRGENMPAKSTYFYPKVLSGLVINKFD